VGDQAARPEPKRREAEPSRPERRAPSDLVVAALVALGAALLFLTTFSGDVSLGDAPESVAGVKSLGVLHAPGYPAYVLAARAFATLEPLGSWALRVNLFSVVCASLTIGVVYLIARRFGAGVTGAVIGAFTLATTVSVWFYAGFAKHYPFSALLVATAILCFCAWEATGRPARLVLSAVLLGACTGASWQLAVIVVIGFVVAIVFGERKPRVVEAVIATGALAAVAVALLVFLLVRARQDPALNWGDARTVARLVDLVRQRDFGLGGSSVSGFAVLGRVPGRTMTYLGVLVHELGIGAILLAIGGAVGALWRSGRAHALFLAVVGVLNIAFAIVAAGLDKIDGFQSGLIVGGFLLDVFIVVAILVALGTTELLQLATEWARSQTARPQGDPWTPGRIRAGITVVVVAALLVPSVVVHYQYANHREPPFVDRYAQRVLAELPPHAVLVVGGYGWALPILYRQIVDHERTDVTVVDGGTTTRAWYREQLSRRYDVGGAIRGDTDGYDPLVRLIKYWRTSRPVFLDTTGMAVLRDAVGYRAQGFIGEVVFDGSLRDHPGTGLDAIATQLDRADVEDGVTTQARSSFPNATIYLFHERAHVELAKEYFAEHRLDGVERELRSAVALYPSDPQAAAALRMVVSHDPQLTQYIKEI
jgi:hypothetical protein